MFTTMLSYVKRASTKSDGIAAFVHFNCNQKIAQTRRQGQLLVVLI